MSVHSEWNGDRIKAKIRAAEVKGLDRAGEYVVSGASLLCPVLTGNLRGSLTHVVQYPIVRVGSPVTYATPVEYGTSRITAQPYFRPALSKKNEIKTIFAEEYKAAMK